jgi:hypothetical protein
MIIFGKNIQRMIIFGKNIQRMIIFGKNIQRMIIFGKNVQRMIIFGKNVQRMIILGKNAQLWEVQSTKGYYLKKAALVLLRWQSDLELQPQNDKCHKRRFPC